MAVTWKNPQRFKPAVVLKRVSSVRTVNPEGGASFSGFELENCLPALHSMLNFPDAASQVDTANLVWRGLSKVKGELTPTSFLAAVNAELSEKLATKEEIYFLLTSVSIDHRDVPKTISIADAKMSFFPKRYPARFTKARATLLGHHKVPVESEPDEYCRVVVKVKAKTVKVAVNRALRALDLQRSLWCLMGNRQIQLAFGHARLEPINVVRLGSKHTIHLHSGACAQDGLWFEPGFMAANLYRPEKPDVLQANSQWALRRIRASKYGEKIVAALLRFVRALDESDANTAFLRLWSALESLTTPDQAHYDSLVKRSSFLFQETEYHCQLLEHLREYRNATVHAGEESERARTHCFQLQLYFVNMIWFHLRNAGEFSSLGEANEFLDFSVDKTDLKNKLRLTKKAIKFIS
jgi:hypothetical protein